MRHSRPAGSEEAGQLGLASAPPCLSLALSLRALILLRRMVFSMRLMSSLCPDLRNVDVLPSDSLDSFNCRRLLAFRVDKFFQKPHCLKRILYCLGLCSF